MMQEIIIHIDAASAIAEAAKTSDTFGEFKTKIEQTTITESI
jgi:hypothetical protein